MKLLRIILILFAAYFIRRFIQMYRALKQLQAEQSKAPAHTNQQRSPKDRGHIVEAEYKVVDS